MNWNAKTKDFAPKLIVTNATFFSGWDDVGVCSKCFEFYFLDDLDDCGSFCYNCMDSNNECDHCEKKIL
jgi:hypothetical protein